MRYGLLFPRLFMLPYWNPYKEDGSLALQDDGSWKGTTENPLAWMANNPLSNKKYKLLSTFYAEVTPVKNLTIRSQLSADYGHTTSFIKVSPVTSQIIIMEVRSVARLICLT